LAGASRWRLDRGLLHHKTKGCTLASQLVRQLIGVSRRALQHFRPGFRTTLSRSWLYARQYPSFTGALSARPAESRAQGLVGYHSYPRNWSRPPWGHAHDC